jgi:hypothetical protein
MSCFKPSNPRLRVGGACSGGCYGCMCGLLYHLNGNKPLEFTMPAGTKIWDTTTGAITTHACETCDCSACQCCPCSPCPKLRPTRRCLLPASEQPLEQPLVPLLPPRLHFIPTGDVVAFHNMQIQHPWETTCPHEFRRAWIWACLL